VSSVSTVVDARPAAMINGRRISWGEMRPILNEAAGAIAINEILLDQRLLQATADAGVTITEQDVAAERRLFLEALDRDPATALRLLEEVRNRQGLGPVRFRSLLRRNAMLRALVADRVNVTEANVQQMYDIVHGPRRQVRLIMVPDLTSAQAALVRVKGGASFGDVATNLSTDVSAARGGLLEPMGRADPSYPEALREAIWRLDGQNAISNPILLEQSYAIVQLVRDVPASGTSLSADRERMTRLARIAQERVLMDQLANRLLADASVTIFDDSLLDSWNRSRRR
jgi:parvulin-like peptidyl-prolyl isomerase